ncbi:MAG: glutamate formimidoyltransferase [Gemmatimonadetes bacterium]|nr:glutamate formimidoyltransferase [Gemmatimonadota bacterium]
MSALIECVPNFSEGRDTGIVEAIAASIAAVDGVHLAGMEMDGDHNRSVITFMGSPGDVARGAFEGCRTARDLIDLRRHRGVHPRIGATDVIPFIPLSNCTMDDCVSLARDCGGEIGRSLGIPVYFYGHAALDTRRRELPDIRRGGFERLVEQARRASNAQHNRQDPDLAPDAGPETVHASAGATAVGVRDILVAYNVNLNTDDVRVARTIAQVVREKSGGLTGVRALGLLLPGRHLAQVSMNLTDYRQTGMARAYATVARLAEAQGVEVLESELIGLAPRDALGDAVPEDLRMKPLDPDRYLETHISRFD